MSGAYLAQKGLKRVVLSLDASRLILPGLLLATLGLRLVRLDAALWYDEAFSAWLAELPLGQLVESTLGDVHPPGYYLTLWAVNRLLGHSEAFLRLPSVLAGVGLTIGVFCLGRALDADKKAVWLATGMTAFSPFQIYYSQEARSYALLSLAVVVAALGLLRRAGGQGGRGAGERGSRGAGSQGCRVAVGQLMAVGGSLAALYLHHMALIFVFVTWGVLTLHASRITKPLFVSGLIVAIGFLPGGLFLLRQAGAVGGGYWVPPVTSPGRWFATFDDLLFFTPNNPFVLATACVTSVGLALMVWDLVTSLRGPHADNITKIGRPQGIAPTKFLALVVLGSLLLVTLISLFWQPVLISRVMAPMAPFYYLWLAQTVTRSGRRMITWLVTASPTAGLILAASLAGLMGREDADPGLKSLLAGADAIYHANVGSYVVWHYYLPDVPQFVWPQPTGLDQTLTAETRTAMGMKEIDFQFIKCARLVNWETGQALDLRRWHLIYFHNPVTDPAEIDYVTHLVGHTPSTPIKRLRSDPTVDAWLIRLEPECSKEFYND